MTFDDASRLWQLMRRTKQTELLNDLIAAAVTYARIRTDYRLAGSEGRGEQEQSRSVAHNRLIDACNILSRAMAAKGEDNAWRAELGDDRKNMGDFACFIHCALGLEAR